MNENQLNKMAHELRCKTFNAFIEHGEAHLGGSFSIIELLILLYYILMSDTDKFILSKAHASFPLCILLRDRGFSPVIKTHLEIDEANGIHATTGSLGHGLPIAVGMAIARKKMGIPGSIYVMISDGECQEGTTWESALIAAAHNLDNLILIVDYNKIQALSRIEDVLPLDNLKKKFEAFNWSCLEVEDGHSFQELLLGFKSFPQLNKPKVLLAHTIKGYGIPEFENDPAWHARKIRDNEKSIGYRALKIK
jgi:transketolase